MSRVYCLSIPSTTPSNQGLDGRFKILALKLREPENPGVVHRFIQWCSQIDNFAEAEFDQRKQKEEARRFEKHITESDASNIMSVAGSVSLLSRKTEQ